MKKSAETPYQIPPANTLTRLRLCSGHRFPINITPLRDQRGMVRIRKGYRTGKGMARISQTRTNSQRARFPFPSNGKVHGKREGMIIPGLKIKTFPFPSNGKVHGKSKESTTHKRIDLTCFHSLQTGKCIARVSWVCLRCLKQSVSIPFKRESVSQV